MKNLILILSIGLLFIQCKKDTPITTPTGPSTTAVEFEVPPHFPFVVLPEDNPLTKEGIKLGKMLYYDEMLHPDGNESCASCHIQTDGFASIPANALPHVNLAWSNYFLWNGKIAGSLEDVMYFEIDDFFKTDLSDFQNDSIYPDLFKDAFGTDQITKELMAKAMSQFVRTIVSSNSKYDQFFRGEVELTPQEYRGYELFNSESGDCFHCHALPLLADNQFHNTGLDSVFTPDNWGRYEVTGFNTDKGKFKTPTLRNIALTPPYMHDGRFNTLTEVVEFYNSGTKHSFTLDPIMTKPGKELGLQLSPEEVQDLVAFMKTFTDPDLLSNPAYNSPFD